MMKTFIFAIEKNALRTDGRTDGPMDGPTDRRTDRPSYRDARTHLKTELGITVQELHIGVVVIKIISSGITVIIHAIRDYVGTLCRSFWLIT